MEQSAEAVHERARHTRWLAERLSDEADRKRLNNYADELERQALALQAAEQKEAD